MKHRTDGLVSGAAVLAGAILVASAGNYAVNVILGRWLGPAAFGDVALMLTLLMLSTVITASVQLVTAKTVAEAADDGERLAAVAHLRRRAGRLALVVGGVALLVSPVVAEVLNVAQPLAVAVMAVGLPLHVRLAVDRGVLQGDLRLPLVAASFLGEVVVRVGCSVALVAIGGGVLGATVGLNAGFLGGLLVTTAATIVGSAGALTETQAERLRATSRQLSVLLVATTIINNGDVIAAKFFLDPATAGRYAAIALVGRAVFFLSWSVQQAVVPVAARAVRRGEDSSAFETGSVLFTAVIAFGLAGGVWLADDLVVGAAFGTDYLALAHLLGPYAAATACWAVANVMISIDVSKGRRAGVVLAMGAAVVQTGSVIAAGSTAAGIVGAQVWVMAGLLGAVLGLQAYRRRLMARTPLADRVRVGATV